MTCDRSMVFSINKTCRHNITELLLKVELNTITQSPKLFMITVFFLLFPQIFHFRLRSNRNRSDLQKGKYYHRRFYFHKMLLFHQNIHPLRRNICCLREDLITHYRHGNILHLITSSRPVEIFSRLQSQILFCRHGK